MTGGCVRCGAPVRDDDQLCVECLTELDTAPDTEATK